MNYKCTERQWGFSAIRRVFTTVLETRESMGGFKPPSSESSVKCPIHSSLPPQDSRYEVQEGDSPAHFHLAPEHARCGPHCRSVYPQTCLHEQETTPNGQGRTWRFGALRLTSYPFCEILSNIAIWKSLDNFKIISVWQLRYELLLIC